jgi:hypothetical protein
VESFPCSFSNERLLREVINSEFAFFKKDNLLQLHTDHACHHLRTGFTTVVNMDLDNVHPDHLCPSCTGRYTPLIRNWHQSVKLSGPALYTSAISPLTPDDGHPIDIGTLLIERVLAHYQVMTLPALADPTRGIWIVSVVPATPTAWLNRHIYENSMPQAGPVAANDTPALIECALRLWESSNGGPLATLDRCIEAARTIL